MKKRTSFVRDDGVTVVMEDGVLDSEIPPGDGIRRFFHENGALKCEVPVVGGETHGVARDWHDNGQLASETNYSHGKIQGVIRDWDTDGSLLHEREYVLPNAVYHKTYADVGRIRHVFLWNGKPVSKARWLKKLEEAGMAMAELEQRFGTARKSEAK